MQKENSDQNVKDAANNVASDIKLDNFAFPDRYENLARFAVDKINTIIVSVPKMMAKIDAVQGTMRASKRGAFMILRGDSGVGKTTFLHTLNLHRHNVATHSIKGGEDVPTFLKNFSPTEALDLEIIVLEEREASTSFTETELDTWLHSINGFIRSDSGKNCLVVWPCNSDSLKERLVKLASAIGGKSLLGRDLDAVNFDGLEKNQFTEVAAKTLAALNQGANLSDFGLTTEEVEKIADKSTTIGDFLGEIREVVFEKHSYVSGLLEKEHPNVWVVVIAGNDPEGDVAGLTRGNLAQVDMDRLMSSTGANITLELRKHPEKLGILATVLNAKILYLPVLAANSIVRAYAAPALQERLKEVDFSIKPQNETDAINRIMQSELGSIFQLGQQKTLTRGRKPRENTRAAFEKIAAIAQSNDAEVNRAVAEALKASGLISEFEIEDVMDGEYKVRTDILAEGRAGKIRIEMMWRKRTGRAEIANYTLSKLQAYGKAIGFLEP